MEANNLERRVRALEQQMAAHEAWGRESAKNMDENFRRLDQANAAMSTKIQCLDDKIDDMKAALDKTSAKVAMMVVGASVLVSSIMAVIHYATR